MTIKKSTPNEDFVDALSNPEVIGPQHNHHHHQSHRPNPHLDKLKTQRKHEKERLRGLNVKLEAYLEKIKNLERQNDTLIELIGELKHRLLSDSDTVKHDFELPLNILKKNLNAEAGHELTAKLKMRRVKYLMEVTRLKLVELANESRQNAAKIEQLKSYRDSLNQEKQSLLQKFDHLNASMEKHRGKTDELNFKLQRVHDELDRQILERVRVESERQRLIEEIEFNKSVNTLFKDETQRVARSAVNKSSLDETYYSGELRSSISKMRDDFGKLAEENRTQLLAFYQSKLDKYESELKNRESVSAVDDHKRAQEVHILKTFDDRFRKDIDYLSAVNTALENKYNELWQKLDALRSHNQKELRERENLIEYLKHQLMESLAEKGLEPSDIKPEFKIFEKLLDLSSNCISRKQQVNTNQTNVRQESQVKSTNDRLVPKKNDDELDRVYLYNTAVKNTKEIIGPIGIRDVSIDSKCIIIENLSDRNFYDLSGWHLERMVDGKQQIIKVQLPDSAILQPKSRLNLWCGKSESQIEPNSKSDIVYESIDHWGKGKVIVTKLFDAHSDVKSIHTQKFIY